MTAIKICGITRREDAAAAADLGANAVGFVLWRESPRHANLASVADIVPTLPVFVTPVGVFVNPSEDEVMAAIDAGIRVAQVHGEVPAWRQGRPPLRIIRAVHLGANGGDAIEPDVADATVLLDAHDPLKHGGTGKTVDWARAAQVARTRQVILAGGLTPRNVRQAIADVRPYAVDVASGVEASPGIKDHGLLRQFIERVKETV